jgi:hypothetical protein
MSSSGSSNKSTNGNMEWPRVGFITFKYHLYPTAARLSIIDNELLGRSLMIICFERKYC